MKKQPKKGELWYIRLPGATCLMQARIEDLTPATVELRNHDKELENLSSVTALYERKDIKFVERVK